MSAAMAGSLQEHGGRRVLQNLIISARRVHGALADGCSTQWQAGVRRTPMAGWGAQDKAGRGERRQQEARQAAVTS